MTTHDARPRGAENRITAEDLLTSPRGRSLVFGLAQSAREDEFDEEGEPLTAQAHAVAELRTVVFIAAFLADRAQGAAVMMYLGEGDSEPNPGDVTAHDVAEKLRSLTPRTPTRAELEDQMAEVIGSAMYWQPPHGDDQIAAAPAVCEALRPFAEALIATGLLDTWSEPLDAENQWALAWDDEDHSSGLPAVFDRRADGTGVSLPWPFAEWLADILTTETRYRRGFAKNPFDELTGEWWSTPPIGLWSSTGTWSDGTPIGVELVEDGCGLERAQACRLRLRPGARIVEIREPADWADLCRRFPLDVTAQRRQVWAETTGRKGRWVIPDWSRVAEEFDGVHVGLAGYLRTAGAVIDVTEGHLGEESTTIPTAGNTDDRTASLMAGWHPDTTFWLNDVIDTVTEVANWHYDDDAERWVRG